MDKRRFVQKIDAARDGAAVGWRQLTDAFRSQGAKAVAYVPEGVEYATQVVEQVPVELFTPPSAQGAVLMLHGGNYILPVVDDHRAFANQVALGSGKTVVLVDYATEPYRYPDALREVYTVWQWLYGRDDRLCFLGDGSGANMALQLAMLLRGGAVRMPGGLVLLSPQVDMTAGGDSYYDNYYLDVVYGKKKLSGLDIPDAFRHSEMWAYADGQDLASPEISPLFADLGGMPPCHITVGEHEVLLSDATRLAESLRLADVPCTLTVGKGLFYAYPMCYRHLPEAKEALTEICAFLRSR